MDPVLSSHTVGLAQNGGGPVDAPVSSNTNSK